VTRRSGAAAGIHQVYGQACYAHHPKPDSQMEDIMKPKHTLTELLTAQKVAIEQKLWYEQANGSNIASSKNADAWYRRIADLRAQIASIDWWLLAVREVEMMDRADNLFAEALLRKMDLGLTEPPSLFDQVIEITKAYNEMIGLPTQLPQN
jgi:hypothetical protein